MPRATGAAAFTRYGRYTTAAGERELAAADDSDRQVYVLVDALAVPVDGELDAYIVDDGLISAPETAALARDYLARARQASGPLVR